jgi:hypothetical protein
MSSRKSLTVGVLWIATVIGTIPNVLAGEFSPIVEGGVNFHTGELTKSLNGATSYFVSLRAEKNKGFLHLQEAAEVEFGSGTAYVGSAQPSFTLLSGSYVLGAYIFPFGEGRIRPFLGGNGVMGWSQLKLSNSPAGVDPNTQGIVFGYELSAGVDIRTGSSEGTAIRVRTGYWSTSGTLAGQTGFQLPGFRFSLGLVF